ncbi:MAG TPA: TIGR04222 domain-containing membrane protein, partial [Acidobacteriota bacterium]|nr:TIGR04222 domain-containing membrane protein [Acidobacteriota bacterium]
MSKVAARPTPQTTTCPRCGSLQPLSQPCPHCQTSPKLAPQPVQSKLMANALIILAGVLFLCVTALLISKPGIQFLGFYLAAGIGVCVGNVWVRHRRESGQTPKLDFQDPYLIAYLRGGAPEALRIATVELLTRKLLVEKVTVDSSDIYTLIQANPAAKTKPQTQIEASLLVWFQESNGPTSIFDNTQLTRACLYLNDWLEQLGLLPNQSVRRARRIQFGAAFSVLIGLAGLKIVYALATGHTNILFLVLLAIGFSMVLVKTSFPRRTGLGDQVLKDLKKLYQSARNSGRNQPGNKNEVMLASVFGLAALPPTSLVLTRTPVVAHHPT